jgi:hypothetical protein
MKRDVVSGTLLIAGPAAGVLLMAMHPTAHGLMSSETGPRLARVNTMVHGLALVSVPIVFLGLVAGGAVWR